MTFSQVKDELDKKNTVLIDVREKGELSSDGKIKESYNIPCNKIKSTMHAKLITDYQFDKCIVILTISGRGRISVSPG